MNKRDMFEIDEGCFVVSSSGTSRSGSHMSTLVDSFGQRTQRPEKTAEQTVEQEIDDLLFKIHASVSNGESGDGETTLGGVTLKQRIEAYEGIYANPKCARIKILTECVVKAVEGKRLHEKLDLVSAAIEKIAEFGLNRGNEYDK